MEEAPVLAVAEAGHLTQGWLLATRGSREQLAGESTQLVTLWR